MTTLNASISVIGAGSYGTALAITLARNGHPVLLWGHNPQSVAQLSLTAATPLFCPMFLFPITSFLKPI